jgi:hypothetical protein
VAGAHPELPAVPPLDDGGGFLLSRVSSLWFRLRVKPVDHPAHGHGLELAAPPAEALSLRPGGATSET